MPLKNKKKAPSTQKYLPIMEIKDDLVVLKDGTLRKVLLVSSINFSLKSEDEQQAIIQGYVQFLNSIDFPLQVVIQSRELNISDYLERLKSQVQIQDNELLKIQTQEYYQYITELVSLAEIMEKRFYVVVPYSPTTDKQKNFWTKAYEVLSPFSVVKVNQKKIAKYLEELQRRMSLVQGGLEALGLSTVALDTRGLIELYYQVYNPGTATDFLKDINKVQIEEQNG